jgi:hypothetical protein
LSKSDGSTTRSFRVSDSALKVIETEAESQGVSVNTFVNQLFTKYAKVQRYLTKENWFLFPQPVLKDLFALIPDDKAAELGKKHGATTGFQNLLRGMTGGSTVANVLQFLKMVCDINSINYTDIDDGRTRRFAMMHNINRQYSVFISNFGSTAFGTDGVWPRIVLDDRVVVFEIED